MKLTVWVLSFKRPSLLVLGWWRGQRCWRPEEGPSPSRPSARRGAEPGTPGFSCPRIGGLADAASSQRLFSPPRSPGPSLGAAESCSPRRAPLPPWGPRRHPGCTHGPCLPCGLSAPPPCSSELPGAGIWARVEVPTELLAFHPTSTISL